MLLATYVAPAAAAKLHGSNGLSTQPYGAVVAFLSSGVVGDAWPPVIP